MDKQTEGATDVNSLLKAVHDLSDAVKRGAEENIKLDQRMSDIMAGQKHLSSKKQLWNTNDADGGFLRPEAKGWDGSLKGLIHDAEAKEGSDVEHLQQLSDGVFIWNHVLSVKRSKQGVGDTIENSKIYKLFVEEAKKYAYTDEATRKALNTQTTGTGADWIPTNFSSSLIELVRLELKVAQLHQRFTMPTNPFKFPMESSDMTAYLVPESLSDTSTSIPTSTPGTTNLTFTAKKLASRVLVSTEQTEDSVIAMLPWLRKRIAHAIAAGIEYAIINGDTAGIRDNTDQAGSTISATSNIKAWDGYRKIAAGIGGVQIDSAGAFATGGQHLRRIRASLGKYGLQPSQVAWVTSPRGYNKMLDVVKVQTLDLYGPGALILAGELGKYENIPIIVSEHMRSDLDGDGVSGGATSVNVDTAICLVNKDGFMLGDKRQFTLKSEENIDTDQVKLVATQRLAFNSVWGTGETTVGTVYDLE